MSDLGLAIQSAVVAKLKTAGLGHDVFSVVPDNLKPPATVVAESSFTEIGSKTGSIEAHLITVRTFIAGQSKTPLLMAMGRVKAALHNQPIAAAGFAFGDVTQVQGGELRDIDEAVLVSEQVFQVIGQKL